MITLLDLEGFKTFLGNLVNKIPEKVITKSVDGDEYIYTFMKMQFSGYDIILYDTPHAMVGIIQDSPIAPMEDYIEMVFEDLEAEGECQVYIDV